MRLALSVFFLFASFVLEAAQTSLRNIEKVNISGNEYVRLLEWCDNNDLKLVWTKKDEDLRATNRFNRLFFSADSRKTEINGVTVLLSLPILSRNSVPFISTVDLQTTLHPLLIRSEFRRQRLGPFASTLGTVGKTREKWTAAAVTRNSKRPTPSCWLRRSRSSCRNRTSKSSWYASRIPKSNWPSARTSPTKPRPIYSSVSILIPPMTRACEASKPTACLLLVLNPATQAAVNRTRVIMSATRITRRTLNSPYQVHKSIVKSLGMEDRGIKRARFEVLRVAKMPGILVEGGFMSNSSEARKIYDSAWRKRMAQSVVDGVLAYTKLVQPETQLVAQKPPVKDSKKKTARD